MASFDIELLDVAEKLVARESGRKGKLPQARVRRSISTSYYALFHFVLNDVTYRVVGSGAVLSKQRRLLARAITHAGLKTTLAKIVGTTVDASIASFLALPNDQAPRYARSLAKTFADAQNKRHDADYDMNETLNELDARLLQARVKGVIRDWRAASSREDKAFKHALSILILLKGQVRKDN